MNLKADLVKLTAVAGLSLAGIASVNAAIKPQTVQAATKSVTINYVPGYGVAVWNAAGNGHTTGQYLPHASSWKVIKTTTDASGNTWYDLGNNQWVMGKYTVSYGKSVAQAPSANTTSSKVQAIISLAKAQIGKPYVYGAAGPYSFDCSGLTSYVFSNAAGINIGRTTYAQVSAGKRVSVSQLQPGDLIFWGNYHVGIYLGNGQYIHAPQPGENVKVATISSYFYPSYGVRVL